MTLSMLRWLVVDYKGWKLATMSMPGGVGNITVGARPKVKPGTCYAARSYPVFRKLSHVFFVLRVVYRYISTAWSTKWVTGCKIQLTEQRVIYCAVASHVSYSLRMALWGLNMSEWHIVNKAVLITPCISRFLMRNSHISAGTWTRYKNQNSETNVMHFLFNLLRIKGLYVFRALLAHPQEALHERHLIYCMRVMSVGCTRISVQSWCSELT
jgi:hypothetical protein